MFRRLIDRWRRRREDLPAALRRAIAREEARGGAVTAAPADLGDVLSGRCGLLSVGEAAPDLEARLEDVVRGLYETRQPAREVLPMTWRQRQDLIDLCERIPNGPEVA